MILKILFSICIIQFFTFALICVFNGQVAFAFMLGIMGFALTLAFTDSL